MAAEGGDTIFGKILRKEIPTTFIHEDEQVAKLYPILFYSTMRFFPINLILIEI